MLVWGLAVMLAGELSTALSLQAGLGSSRSGRSLPP